ncbi:hypothetical protein BAAM0499_03795 [Bifidobacterium animalis subsp. animalis MCC 0499]|uniref:hypothetical protein n=1 Tax=Bifidobacterium animalis TaxID=28025 RepID=UPI00069B94F4|nr:hypothetical protein [Bifidobacterium animalis]KOA61002.1 hypothetical protein BAAM0499_03795 [Bifidobacterium animalis subsp. animalis MCC 0499]
MNQTRRPKGSPGGTGGQYAPGLEHADMLPDLSDYDTRGPVFNPDMRAMLTDYAGEHADDYDMDAVEAAYRDMLDKQLHTMGVPAHMGVDETLLWEDDDGSQWKSMPESQIIREAADQVDLDAILQAHDDSVTTDAGEHYTRDQWDAVVNMMDPQIREQLHNTIAPCSNQMFFDEYAKAHEAKYGQTWELAKPAPVW